MLTDEYRYKLLRLLEANPRINQRELARALGISLGKVNYCLNALIEKGLVKARNFTNSKNKRAYMYYLTPHGFEEKARVTIRFFRRKLSEYETLRGEIEALRAEAALAQARAPDPGLQAGSATGGGQERE
jgi:EPS-associated MarR family transcriptional regulator